MFFSYEEFDFFDIRKSFIDIKDSNSWYLISINDLYSLISENRFFSENKTHIILRSTTWINSPFSFIFWHQKIYFVISRNQFEFLISKNNFLISENWFFDIRKWFFDIKNFIFWYQKILHIFWYQKIIVIFYISRIRISDIKKSFLILKIRFFWYFKMIIWYQKMPQKY